MDADKYIFTPYQKIGAGIKSFFLHKYFIIAVLFLACCIYLPSLFTGYQYDDYIQLLHFDKQVSKKMNLKGESYFSSIFDLYAFSGIISQENIDRGYMPWWSSRSSIGSFFRPVTSLLLALDYSLWRDYPVVVHIHSLTWFFMLIVIVYYTYRNIHRSAVLAGFSCFLFVLDDLNAWPVSFIANRHIIVSAVFTFASFLAYIRYSRGKNGLFLLLSYILFIAGLLSSETGITIGAYLFSFFLFLDKNPPVKKAATLVPFVNIIIGWRLFYTMSGYGVYNQLLYIDPLNNPLEFLHALVIRYPLHLFSVVFFPVSEILLFSAPSIHIFLSMLALCVVMLLFFILYPCLKKEKLKLFWLAGMLLSLIPPCMGMPSTRILTFPCIGLMGLSGILIGDRTEMSAKKALSTFRSFLIRIITPLFLILYMVISPFLFIIHYTELHREKEYRTGLTDFGDIPMLNEKTIVVVKPPNTSAVIPGLVERAFTQNPIPEFVRLLSPGIQPLELLRIDENSLFIKPEGGYHILPSEIKDPATGKVKYFDDRLFYRWMETLYHDPQSKWKKGDCIVLTGLTIKVMNATEDGRILEALFEFEEPLESGRYEWIIWDPAASGYRPFPLLGIGERIRI